MPKIQAQSLLKEQNARGLIDYCDHYPDPSSSQFKAAFLSSPLYALRLDKKRAMSSRLNLRSPRLVIRYALSIPRLLQRLTVLLWILSSRATSLTVSIGSMLFSHPSSPFNIVFAILFHLVQKIAFVLPLIYSSAS